MSTFATSDAMLSLIKAMCEEIDVDGAKGGRAGAISRMRQLMSRATGVPVNAWPIGWQVIYGGGTESDALLSSIIYPDKRDAEWLMGNNPECPKFIQPVYASSGIHDNLKA